MSSRALHWPRQILRERRRALDTGHGSFRLLREPAGDAFERQDIRLKGHLLLIVTRGSAILESGGAYVLLVEGDAVALSDTDLALTEIPRPGRSDAKMHLFFFGDAVVGEKLRRMPGVEQIAQRVQVPSLPFYIRSGFAQQLDVQVKSQFIHYPWEFSKVLTSLLNTSLQFFGFLKHGYLRRRAELQSFLIQHRLACQTNNFAAIEAAYPEGSRALRKACRVYLHRPPERWMRLQSDMLDAFARLKDRKEALETVTSKRPGLNPEEFRRIFFQVNGSYPEEVAGQRTGTS